MTFQLPVLVSSSDSRLFVADVVDRTEFEALGNSESDVIAKLKRKLRRASRKGRLRQHFDWTGGSVHTKNFTVQPMYVEKGRRYLAGPKIQMPVRYIRLIDTHDKRFCVLPEFGEEFYFPDEDVFASMLSDTVHSITSTLSPREVNQLWPPSVSSLHWLRSSEDRRRSRRGLMEDTLETIAPTLSSVAQRIVRKGTPVTVAEIRSGDRDQILSHLQQSGCLVVGGLGVGKSTVIAQSVAQLNQQERELANASDARNKQTHFWVTSSGRLIAGMQYLGQWEERLETVLAELSDTEGVLVVENLKDLLLAGGQEPRDSIGAFLLPYLRSGQVRLLAESSPEEIDAARQMLPDFVDALPHVHIQPLPSSDENRILEHMLAQDARNRHTTYDPKIAQTLSRLCRQYQRHAAAPGPAVDLLRSALAQRPSTLTYDDILLQFSIRTGLPDSLLRPEVTLDRQTVVDYLSKQVIGQTKACELAAGVVTRIKSSLTDPARPFSCMLFCGPTGVGKTQLAKTLAEYLFGEKSEGSPLVRLDMSEYASMSAGTRFLEDINGNAAKWITSIRARPLSILLLDEIEKANLEIFDILLSLLDEGRLTDRQGRSTSFRNTVVIMTSNTGASKSSSLGFQRDNVIDYPAAVRKAFRPEFFNRLDAVVQFASLDAAAIRQIANKELAALNQRDGIVGRSLDLLFDDSLIDHIATVGFDAALGARPLQRQIESDVTAALARWIIEHPDLFGEQLQLSWSPEHRRLVVANPA
jgi:ATP-dependent Clp protease ATP-binding subunit ClpC